MTGWEILNQWEISQEGEHTLMKAPSWNIPYTNFSDHLNFKDQKVEKPWRNTKLELPNDYCSTCENSCSKQVVNLQMDCQLSEICSILIHVSDAPCSMVKSCSMTKSAAMTFYSATRSQFLVVFIFALLHHVLRLFLWRRCPGISHSSAESAAAMHSAACENRLK